MDTERRLILDVSVMGMGRGAGNLNGELMVSHMNEYFGKDYVLKPLLRIIDEILNVFYKKRYWGYSCRIIWRRFTECIPITPCILKKNKR